MRAWQFIKVVLSFLPRRLKPGLFKLATKVSAFCGLQIQYIIYRLPVNITLKTTLDTNVESIQGVEPPVLPTLLRPQIIVGYPDDWN